MRNHTKINGVMARLPRYYKDKMFNEEEREAMRIEITAQMAQTAREELVRLKKFHADPSHYYQELLAVNHGRITKNQKVNII